MIDKSLSQYYDVPGTKKIKGQLHKLAYITPKEAKLLQKSGGQKVMTPEGIPAYPPPGERGGPGSGAEGRSPGGGGGGGGAAAQAAASAAAAARSRAAAAEAAAKSKRDMQATIAKAEKAETAVSQGEGKVDVGFQEALKKQNIISRGEGKVDVGFQEILRKKQIEEDLRQKQKDPNFGQFFRPQPVVEKKPSGFLKGLGTLAASVFLPAILPAKLAKTYTTYKQLKTASSLVKKFGLTKDDKMLSLRSKFLNPDMRKQLLKDDTPKVANLTNKKKRTTDDRGDGMNRILPESLQSTVSEGTQQFLSDEQKEQYLVAQNKMKAALAEGYYGDQNGKRIALDDEQVNALTQFITKIDNLLVDPVMMADGGRVDKAFGGRIRDI